MEADEAKTNDSKVEAFIFLSQSFINKGIVQVEFILADEVEYSAMIDALLEHASSDDHIKSLVLHIEAKNEELMEVLAYKSFHEVSETLNLGPSSEEGEDVWIKLFTMSKTDNWPARWVLVPTEVAVFAIYGDANKITQTRWFPYGKYIEDIAIRTTAIKSNLADLNGIMLSDLDDAKEHKDEDDLPAALVDARNQAQEYFSGKREEFDLPLVINNGTNFQRKVWDETKNISYAATETYESLGTLITGDELRGRNLSRVTGAALGANPICVFIPCHRIIAKNGNLQGYKYGIEVKDWLLSHEIFKWKEDLKN